MHKYNSYGTWEENNNFWDNNEYKCVIYSSEKLNNNIKNNIIDYYESKGSITNSEFNSNNNSNKCMRKNRNEINRPLIYNNGNE